MKSISFCFIFVALMSLYGCKTINSLGPVASSEVNTGIEPAHDTMAPGKKLFKSEAGSTNEVATSLNSTSDDSTEKKAFGSWVVECKSAKTDCAAILKVKNKAENQIFVLIVNSVKKEKLESSLIVTAWLPLGFYLPEPVKVHIGDQDTPFLLSAQYCSPQGCFAACDAPDSIVSALKQSSNKVTVSMIQFFPKKQINFSFTQNGFPEAYQYLLKMQ